MPTLTLPPPPATTAGPTPKRWTCAEFHRLGDAGAFECRRAMLIDGVILEAGPMNPPHANAIERGYDALRAAFGRGWRVRCQLPLVLGRDTDPLPDFAVIAGTSGSGGHPTTAALVVEVADSSLDFDTGDKRLLYARAGIADYWVVDVAGRRLLVYRDPRAGDYGTQQILGPADSVAPLALPTTSLAVADLLV